METISNMATAAAQAVWPNNNKDAYRQEPLSGETGNVAKGEPYDAGNIEHVENASAAKASSKEPGDSTKEQNDTRDPADPQTKPAEAEKRENVDDSGAGPDDDSNPVKVDGPGPKPIEVVAKEHHGDAGNVGKDGENGTPADGAKPEAAADEEEEEEDGPQKKSHGEGTGEQYVKSTGLNADGGDFDAKNPGAGKEADRLLEEKGGHNPAADGGKAKPVESNGSGKETKETKEKKSLGQKIKEKLKVGSSSSS